MRTLFVLMLVFVSALSGKLSAQAAGSDALPANYRTNLDVPYAEDGNWQGRLDVYAREGTSASPTVIWWHGANGTKKGARRAVSPLLEIGFSAILPQAPDSPTSRTPPSVEKNARRVVVGRCALKWALAHAKEYQFDTTRLVVAGTSLGGYTALMTGLVNGESGFDQMCQGGSQEPRVAAILNFFGPIRLPAQFGVLSPRLLPLTYVRKSGPPILTIHGDSDGTVPYADGVELNEALARIGAAHEFVTVSGGDHGLDTWRPDQLSMVWARIRNFLSVNGLEATR